jgi:hypothetical protein
LADYVDSNDAAFGFDERVRMELNSNVRMLFNINCLADYVAFKPDTVGFDEYL